MSDLVAKGWGDRSDAAQTDAIETLTAERDRARDTAVALEQECARLTEALARATSRRSAIRDAATILQPVPLRQRLVGPSWTTDVEGPE